MADVIERPSGAEFNTPPPEGWAEMDVSLGAAPAVSLGLIALANDSGIEADIHDYLCDRDIVIHTNRIYSPRHSNLESLRAMESGLAAAAANIMPDDDLDAIAYGCTSATMALGPDAVVTGVQSGRAGIPVVDPISASLAGLEQLGCRRIALLTPYIGEVNEVVEAYISGRGFDIAAKGFFGVFDDRERSSIPYDAFAAAADRLAGDPGIDAFFMSCTAMRTAGAIEKLEARLGKPVVASNQALAWALLRAGGDMRAIEGRGRLFTL